MVGTTLNHYRIARALGTGGMGEVYLAEDTRLKRSVAIKILPAELAADPDRRERFEREAQAVAALNHPNIVTVHSVEQSGEVHFITMEFVDGRTLGDLIPKAGMPLAKLLPLATQLVDAVIAAHSRGIVHRDLKPANVMVATGDRVKVLDFGLAKLRELTDDVAAGLPTRELTGEGKIVGTVAYMSPEQAEGKPVDERSDMFSLGVILYEMATGVRPFSGATSLAVLSSILRDTPKTVTDVNPGLPRDLSRIVRHCLAKDPDRRYQSAKDLRNELDDLAQSLSSGELDAASVVRHGERSRWPMLLGGAGALAIVGAGVLAILWSDAPDTRGAAVPVMSHSRLTQKEGVERFPSMSPDGKWVVYNSDGDIYLQSVTGQTAINLTKDSPANDTKPAFSPDGETIAFRSERDGGGIFLMGRTGESVRRLTTKGFDPAWFPDGHSLVYAGDEGPPGPENRGAFSDLWVVGVTGDEPRRLFGGDAVQPRVSPHGKRIAFWSLPSDPSARRLNLPGATANRDIWTIDVNGTSPVRVTTHDGNDWNPVWSPDGRWLYFLSNRSGSMNLWRVAIDESSGAASGEPQPLTAPAPYVADFSLSADGTTGVYSSVLITSNISRVTLDAKTATAKGGVEAVTRGTNDFTNFDVTGDGRFVAGTTSSRTREDIYSITVSDGTVRQLTNDFARDRSPRWSADGREVLFYSDRRGYQLWSIAGDGAGLRQLTHVPDVYPFYPVPSRDGARIAATESNGRQLYIYDARDFTKFETLPAPPSELGPSPRVHDWSPDDRSLAVSGGAFTVSGGAFTNVWIHVFDTRTRTYRRVAQGISPVWLDGRRLVYAGQAGIRVVDTVSGVSSDVLALPGETLGTPRLTADRSQLFFTRSTNAADVWVVRFGEK